MASFGKIDGRLPLALAMVAALAAALGGLERRFDGADVRKGVAAAMAFRPRPGGASVFEALVARGEGDPRCDGEVVSAVLGDVAVRCATPARPEVWYAFRVLLDGMLPPKPEGPAAEGLVLELRGP